MATKTDPNLAEIKRTYRLLDDNFDTIYSACDDDQKKALITARDAARDAFWKAVAEDLTDNHDLVAHTLEELQDTNDQIDKDLKKLEDVSEILETVTQAVKLAAALAVLAAA